jgi:reverse gyrase
VQESEREGRMEPWEKKGLTVLRKVLKEELHQDPSSLTIEKKQYSFSIPTGENQPSIYITRGDIDDYLKASTETTRLAAVEKIARKLRRCTKAPK